MSLPADQSEGSTIKPDAEQHVFMTRTVYVCLAQGHINLDPVTEAEGSHKRLLPLLPGFTSCCMRYKSITYRSRACLLTWGLLLHWTTCKTSTVISMIVATQFRTNTPNDDKTSFMLCWEDGTKKGIILKSIVNSKKCVKNICNVLFSTEKIRVKQKKNKLKTRTMIRCIPIFINESKWNDRLKDRWVNKWSNYCFNTVVFNDLHAPKQSYIMLLIMLVK